MYEEKKRIKRKKITSEKRRAALRVPPTCEGPLPPPPAPPLPQQRCAPKKHKFTSITSKAGHTHNNTTRTTPQTNNHANEPPHPTINNAQRWRDNGAEEACLRDKPR